MWPRSEVGISKITDTLHFAYQHGCFCIFSRHTDNKKMPGIQLGLRIKSNDYRNGWGTNLGMSSWKTGTKMEENIKIHS